MRYAGRRRSETNPLVSIPLYRPASILRPIAPLPIAPTTPYSGPHLPPTDDELRRRELANAEAALAGLVNALNVARAGIGEANRTHTAPIVHNGHTVMAARRFSPERMHQRRSYAFRLFNQRRGEVGAARRRVDAVLSGLAPDSLVNEDWPGYSAGPLWRGGLGWAALGAGRRRQRSGPSAPPKVTGAFAAGPAASSSTNARARY